jgi:hypothetical protein
VSALIRPVTPTPSSRTGSRKPARASRPVAALASRAPSSLGSRQRGAPREQRVAARPRCDAAGELQLEHDSARAQPVAAQAAAPPTRHA